jgi:hypothetical protein
MYPMWSAASPGLSNTCQVERWRFAERAGSIVVQTAIAGDMAEDEVAVKNGT